MAWMLSAAVLAAAALPAPGAEPRAEEERGSAEAPGVLARLDHTVGGWVSPGALAEVHADLEGLSGCLSCHTALSGTPDARCLDCHEEIGRRMRERVGVHGRFEGACASCHGEHRGPGADLLGLDREAFNHEQARFALRGAHVEVDCEKCHVRRGPDADVERFHPIGVPFAACSDCHDSPHEEAFLAGRDCGVCHTDRSFDAGGLVLAVAAETPAAGGEMQPLPAKDGHAAGSVRAVRAQAEAARDAGGPAAPEGFDHDRDTGFALDGRHANVPCAGCHTPERAALERERGLDPGAGAPTECGACHRDPHRGALRRACTTCHDTRGWADPHAPFDHARLTRFPLDRVHASLDCTACHDDLRFRAASRECAGCHEGAASLLAGRFDGASAAPDPHDGRVACTDCHAPEASARDLRAYQRACVKCHPPQYASLLLTRRRVLDDLLVEAETRLRRLERARERGEPGTPGPAELRELADRVDRMARSGLHHPELAEAVLRRELERLERLESRP